MPFKHSIIRALSLTLALVPFGLGACTKRAEHSPPLATAPSANLALPTAASAEPKFKVANPVPYENPKPARVGVLAPGTGIPVGERVPEVSAVDLEGHSVTLASLYGQGTILLTFYRGGWCPYCNMEIHSLTAAYPEFQKRHVTPVALSVDLPEAESVTQATYKIPFPVLSDTSAASLLAFHVVNQVDEPTVRRMNAAGVDLEHYSGQSHHEIAIPSLFLIDKSGKVRWAHSDPDFKVRPSTAQLLAAIDALGAS